MSGIFLIVSNFDKKSAQDVLQTTKGGYPHVTLCYTGNKVALKDLASVAADVMKDVMAKELYRLILDPYDVIVNQFYEEFTGEIRYDVLIGLSVGDTEVVQGLRQHCLVFQDKATMRTPHITHSIHYNKDMAESVAAEVRKKLPIDLYITGVTLD